MAGEQQSQYEPPGENEELSLFDRVILLYENMGTVMSRISYRMKNLKQTNMNVGRQMLYQGKGFDAVLRFRIAAWLDPVDANTWYHLGLAYLERERPDKAAEYFGRALIANPHFNDAIYMLTVMNLPAATADELPLPRATPVAVIKRQFDDMAPIYDDMQLGKMDYNGHMVVYDAFVEHTEEGKRRISEEEGGDDSGGGIRMLDIGCGSGLCGDVLRSEVSVLTGVDVSAAMLNRARSLRYGRDIPVYDYLVAAEARSYMHRHAPEAFDIVVAANVLNYFGDIEPFFTGARRILANGGYFIFTTEYAGFADGEENSDYKFDKERMLFSHSEEYLRSLAANAGMTVIDLSLVEIYEGDPGWCMVCRK